LNRSLWLAVATLGIALLGIALACSRDPILVATIEPDSDASVKCQISDAGDAGASCKDGFCSATACGSTGFCESIDSDACASSGPECGCNGVSYFNRCLRQEARVSLAGNAQCGFGMRTLGCTDKDCPTNASCALILPGLPSQLSEIADAALSCGEKVRLMPPQYGLFGVCWSRPDACPDAGSPLVQSDLCEQCIDECSAIKEGGVYFLCAPDASAN
jgi:hypothetical protein